MRYGFYGKLAWMNIRKNRQTYIPYILACALMAMMHYLIVSLAENPGFKGMRGGDMIVVILQLGGVVIRLFALIFLLYANSFLMKRRQTEFGVFNILGLEKKHLAKVLLIETALVSSASLAAGACFGIAFDKAMFLVICKILQMEIPMGFFVSGKAICLTAGVFLVIYLLIYLKAVYGIRVSNPIELLRGSSTGEREPKTKGLMALAGALLLGAGYGLVLTIQDPIEAIEKFFVAVVLVILGTYLLFVAGSIVVLKLLRRNRRFYYRPKNFVSVSGMLYRMGRNAVGLANICILSTMVLVMLSSTSSLMLGMEDVINVRYPNDFGIYSREPEESRNQKLFREVDGICKAEGIPVKGEAEYRYLPFLARQKGSLFEMSGTDMRERFEDARILFFIPLSDYNASAGAKEKLKGKEALFFSNRADYGEDSFRILGMEYEIAGRLDSFFGNGVSESNITSSYYFVVSDEEFAKLETKGGTSAYAYYGFDTTAGEGAQAALEEKIKERMQSSDYDGYFDGYLETRVGNRKDFMSIYGGLFFLGIFLSVLFIMAAVLIIYYKQISEGYEDRGRFEIMQKVGMTQTEVKRAIRSQVLTVFFLPLIVANVHITAAFPFICKLLRLLGMVNVKLYLLCTVVGFLAFAVFYVAIYGLTAGTYYKIVRRR